MKTMNKALLAGMSLATTATASIASPVFQYNDTGFIINVVSIQDHGSGESALHDLFSFDGNATADVDFANVSGTSIVYASDTSFGGSVSVTGSNATVYGSIFTESMMVSETTDVLFEWDKVSTNAEFLGGMTIFDIATGVDVFQPTTGTSGSVIFTLDAGTEYGMIWNMNVYLQNPGEYADLFVNISIVPAPSTAALLGLGALGLTRRRR